MEDSVSRTYLDLVLHPHRSLSARGFQMLMIFLGIVSFLLGLGFLWAGAWPVFGFFGLDVLLLYYAFRLNYRAAEVCETVTLTDSALVIRRLARKKPAQEWRFQPYWVRVALVPGAADQPELMLRSHGRSLTIGSFLTPDERVEVAGMIKQALAAQRNMAFA